MMHRKNNLEQQIAKVGATVAITTLLTSPLLLFSNKQLSILVILALDFAALNYLHEVGKSRRAVDNFYASASARFNQSSTRLRNTLNNVNEGINAILDEIDTLSRRITR